MERSRSQPSMCHGDTDVVWTITKDNLNRIYITEFKLKNNLLFYSSTCLCDCLFVTIFNRMALQKQ